MVFMCQFIYLLWHNLAQLDSIIGRTLPSPLMWLPSITQPLSLRWHLLFHQGHGKEELVKVLYTLPAPHLTSLLSYAYILCFLTTVKDRLCSNSVHPCNLWPVSPSPLSYSRSSVMQLPSLSPTFPSLLRISHLYIRMSQYPALSILTPWFPPVLRAIPSQCPFLNLLPLSNSKC